jgi:hypothetical protein
MSAKWESPLMLLTGFLMGTVFSHLSVDSTAANLSFEQLMDRPQAVKRLVGYYNTMYDPLQSPIWYDYGIRSVAVALAGIYLWNYWGKVRRTLLDVLCLMCLFVSLRQTFAYVVSQSHIFLHPDTVESAVSGEWDKEHAEDVGVAIQATTVGHVGIFMALSVFVLARFYQLYSPGRTYFDRRFDLEEEERRLKHEGIPVFPNAVEQEREKLRRIALQGEHQTIKQRVVKAKVK